MNRVCVLLAVVSLLLSLAGWFFIGVFQQKNIRYGFVNTERLLNEFDESKRAVDRISEEQEKWNVQRAIIEDSLKAFEKRMELSYDSLSVEERKRLKQEQLRRMEELGRFNQARANSLEKRRVEELQAVYQKINVAIGTFAKERKLDVVFASSNGNIVYGNGTSADLTDDFVKFLNEQFR